MEIFDACQKVNDLLESGESSAARNTLIRLLADVGEKETRYPPVLNHLIRATGLYPYMRVKGAPWDQQFVHEAFAVDVSNGTATLHREQSIVLRKLLEGTDLAVSARTSFGKNFIIDAYIAAKSPTTVVIIVPTIALMDETRRRIFKKFSRSYNIVTAPDAPLAEKNIFIFPQERAFGYIEQISEVDLLVIDGFYKASVSHDKERAPSLVKAIIQLSRKSRRRYYLAPNVKKLGKSVFTEDMEFIELLDFNTVYLERHELYRDGRSLDDILQAVAAVAEIAQQLDAAAVGEKIERDLHHRRLAQVEIGGTDLAGEAGGPLLPQLDRIIAEQEIEQLLLFAISAPAGGPGGHRRAPGSKREACGDRRRDPARRRRRCPPRAAGGLSPPQGRSRGDRRRRSPPPPSPSEAGRRRRWPCRRPGRRGGRSR